MSINSAAVQHYNQATAPLLKAQPVKRGVDSSYYQVEPKEALEWSFDESIEKLSQLIGKKNLIQILNGKKVNSPAFKTQNSNWMNEAKIVGVNPRAIGTYFNIVKYAMTFPEDSIHLLPLFEQGCQGSLYAPVNFKLTDEFMDENLTRLGFDTPEKQLKLTINLLHALNKNVGMDFLQHSDRFSEEVFLNPDNFIWAKIDKSQNKEFEYPQIHPDKLGSEVEKLVVDFLQSNGDSKGQKVNPMILENFYNLPEEKRRQLLFGTRDTGLSEQQRTQRRIELMDYIRNCGFETKPISLDDPRRKIVFKEMMSNENASWATFTDNQEDRLFGNLTSYKLYHLDENGEVDINRPNYKARDFLVDKTVQFQHEFGFDFLRADMGYLSFKDNKFDIHAALKDCIGKSEKHFSTFGECFAGFGDNQTSVDDIRRKKYDAVLGDLHYQNVYKPDFSDIVKAYNFSPDFKISLTSITADSDQARYNEHYDNFQDKIRAFLGLFLNQPSYMGMGLETRDVNPVDGKNLTKDFINDWGIKKYEWGSNREFFDTLSGMRNLYSKIKDSIKKQAHYWLWTQDKNVLSWFYYNDKNNKPSYLFALNSSPDYKEETEIENIFDTNIKEGLKDKNGLALREVYSSDNNVIDSVVIKGKKFKLRNLAPGECRVYKVLNPEALNRDK